MEDFTNTHDISVHENKDMSSYYTYFNAVLDNFDEEPYSNLFLDDQDDEKYMLLTNIYDYINKDVLPIILDKKTSKLFEKILERSTIVQILQLSKQFFSPEYLEQLCFNRFASFSIEKIIKIFGFILGLSHSKFEISKSCTKHLNALTELVLLKTNDFTQNPFANHILRELLISLKKTNDEELLKVVDSVYSHVTFDWSQDSKLCGLLQDVLSISNDAADKFMRSCCSEIENSFKEWVFNQNASRLIDKLITSVAKENVMKLVDLIFKDNMAGLTKSDNAMYSVKHLIQRLDQEKSWEVIEMLFLELINSGNVWSLLQSQHYSVICKFLDYQSQYCKETNDLLIAHVVKIAKEREDNLYFNIICLNGEEPKIAGSLLLQHLFKNTDNFNESDIITSLFELAVDMHVRLLMHSAGSHIYDSFYNSTFVSAELKLKFYDMVILNNCKEFAMDKYACRVIEACWTSLDMKRKLGLMEALAKYRNDLIKSPHGRKFARFTSIDAYRKDPRHWRTLEVGKIRNINIFKNVVGTQTSTKKQNAIGNFTQTVIEVPKSNTIKDLDPILDAIKGTTTKEKKRKKKSEKTGIKKKKLDDVFEVEVLE